MNVGAVAAMRNIKHAIAVARYVLWNTQHTLLVGERATEFALMMGFRNESLTTRASMNIWQQWRNGHCQPNFWTVYAMQSKPIFIISRTSPFPFRMFCPIHVNHVVHINQSMRTRLNELLNLVVKIMIRSE